MRGPPRFMFLMDFSGSILPTMNAPNPHVLTCSTYPSRTVEKANHLHHEFSRHAICSKDELGLLASSHL